MREIAGAVLVLAGSVLMAAGIVADAVTAGHGNNSTPGYVLGSIVGLIGFAFLFANIARRAWDAIPVENQSPPKPEGPPT
ncbi:MAG TPA: hypothetical protein VKE40_03690 [Gemmataceae bacterium]|nr:hypothetical protein [Gemmataceae bacterium]